LRKPERGRFDSWTFALLSLDAPLIRTWQDWELSQMDGAQLGGIPLNGPTLIRLVVVLVLAIGVRQLIMWFGTKAIDSRRGKNRNGKPRP
jgi:hypothetical protein